MVDLSHALAALQDGCSGSTAPVVEMEVHVTDKPFWWNNSLIDRDMARLVAALPPNVQVRGPFALRDGGYAASLVLQTCLPSCSTATHMAALGTLLSIPDLILVGLHACR